MDRKEKAKIILENMDKHSFQVDWNLEELYLKGIIEGLKEIERKKKKK